MVTLSVEQVPSSFTQHERAALYAAADIAELRVLSLIEENTAAALHYAIDRWVHAYCFKQIRVHYMLTF